MSADERARDLFERREKARRDMAAREKWARQEGALERNIEIARSMLADAISTDLISKFTGLAIEDIEALR